MSEQEQVGVLLHLAQAGAEVGLEGRHGEGPRLLQRRVDVGQPVVGVLETGEAHAPAQFVRADIAINVKELPHADVIGMEMFFDIDAIADALDDDCRREHHPGS